MSFFDDNPLNRPDENPPAQPMSDTSAPSPSTEPVASSLAGSPISYAGITPAESSESNLPEDLRILQRLERQFPYAAFARQPIIDDLTAGGLIFGCAIPP